MKISDVQYEKWLEWYKEAVKITKIPMALSAGILGVTTTSLLFSDPEKSAQLMVDWNLLQVSIILFIISVFFGIVTLVLYYAVYDLVSCVYLTDFQKVFSLSDKFPIRHRYRPYCRIGVIASWISVSCLLVGLVILGIALKDFSRHIESSKNNVSIVFQDAPSA